MIRNFERGSVAGFVIGGLLLLALLAGGIYVVRHNMAKPGQVATTTTDQGDKITETTKTGETKTEEQNKELKEALNAQANEEKKAEEQLKAQQAESATPAATPAPAASGATTSSPSGSLPTTGPEDAIAPLLGATLLAGATASFVRSRSLL